MKNDIKEIARLSELEGKLPEDAWQARWLQIRLAQKSIKIIKTFMKREKFYIAGIIFLAFLAFYFAFIHKQKIEVIFSKPVSPVGNFTAPDHLDIWEKKY